MTDITDQDQARTLAGLSIAVLGGGVGGLAAALAFAKRGASVRVFEQASELREVGAGLQITPNGAAVVRALGLAEIADHRAIQAAAVVPMDALSGRAVTRFDLGQQEGEPYRFFHRADLLDLLAEGCAAQGVEVILNSKAVEVSDAGVVGFEDGRTIETDLVVGADGLHSVTRKLLNGDDAPFFTGQVAWRSVVKIKDEDPVARIWMAPNRHVVTYPLIGGRLNVVAVQERAEWAAEGWNYFDEPEELRSAFADCSAGLRAVLDQVQTVRLWGLFRHPVAGTWHGRKVALVGDAAHPTLPFLAQGANLAFEDAYVLARCVSEFGVEQGLAHYQEKRRARVIRAIDAANANATNYHLSGVKRFVAHKGLKTIGLVAPRAFLERLDWLYGFDVTA